MVNTINCNICNESIAVDKHHIQSICYGGITKEWNICKICPNCHRKVHTGKIIIEGWYSSTLSTGRVLIHRLKGEKSITDCKDPQVWLY